jgi:hypothetical protein
MLWLLALLAAEVRGRYSIVIALGVAWFVIMGPPPLPDTIDVVVNLLCQGLVFAAGIWGLSRRGLAMSESKVSLAEGTIRSRHSCLMDRTNRSA